MRNRTVWALVILLNIGLTACLGGAPKVDWELTVSGAVSTLLSLSYGELAKMPQTELENILMERSRGEDTHESWTGVPLQSIPDQAGAAADYVSITATAADGYAIEVSTDEVQDAIIALKQNNEWIATVDADHGPIRLVCPKTPANRWVFQLQELQVNQ